MLEFNAVNYNIWGIPGYFFCAGIGFIVAASVFIALVFEKGYSLQLNMKILIGSIICLLLSARLFGCLSGIYRDIGLGEAINSDSLMNTGIVFYGGLFGLLSSYTFFSKRCKQNACIMNVLAVPIPLFHSISRVGCFLGGCCFGKEDSGFLSLTYTTVVFGQIESTRRIPIQLIEAFFDLGIFLYLIYLLHLDDWEKKNILWRYLFLYSIGRFIIEFFRGDLARGVIYGISFSQLISIFIWAYLAISVFQRQKLKNIRG